jgi:predicted lipoprotein with Yx(FWY)xxD motif
VNADVMRRLVSRRAVSAAVAVALAGGAVAGTAMSADASAVSPAHGGRSATVVTQKTHAPFGKMLFTTHDFALYYLPSGSCTGGCLAIWPPLLMPAGKTVPKGASCLHTVKFGRRLQVTYDKHRLYTFAQDSRGTVTGNGVAGFKVAKVVRCG